MNPGKRKNSKKINKQKYPHTIHYTYMVQNYTFSTSLNHSSYVSEIPSLYVFHTTVFPNTGAFILFL